MFVPEMDMVWVHSSVGLGSVGFSGICRWLDWMQFGLWHVTSESAKIHCFDLCVIMLIFTGVMCSAYRNAEFTMSTAHAQEIRVRVRMFTKLILHMGIVR